MNEQWTKGLLGFFGCFQGSFHHSDQFVQRREDVSFDFIGLSVDQTVSAYDNNQIFSFNIKQSLDNALSPSDTLIQNTLCLTCTRDTRHMSCHPYPQPVKWRGTDSPYCHHCRLKEFTNHGLHAHCLCGYHHHHISFPTDMNLSLCQLFNKKNL